MDRPTISQLGTRYLNHRRAGGFLDADSVRSIRNHLNLFCEIAPVHAATLRRSHVERFVYAPGLSASYRRARLSALRCFFKWCVANGHLRSDPSLTVEVPPVGEQIPKRLTTDEARAVANEASGDPRTLLIVLLMLQEGLRRIEIARLCIDDVDFAEHALTIRGKGGRGLRTAVLPITAETWSALTGYLAVEGIPPAGDALIRSRRYPYTGISRNHVSELARRAMVAAGVKKPGDATRTPHSMRHTAAHDMLSNTRDVRAVQKAMRHKSVTSTEIYLNGHVADLRPVMEGRTYLNRGVAS